MTDSEQSERETSGSRRGFVYLLAKFLNLTQKKRLMSLMFVNYINSHIMKYDYITQNA